MKDKFEGLFEGLVRMGSDFVNQQRFTPLSGAGVPLWEFKQHDHRIYCSRRVFPNGSVQAILLHGWSKDKEGKAREEKNQVQIAQNLYSELLKEGVSK